MRRQRELLRRQALWFYGNVFVGPIVSGLLAVVLPNPISGAGRMTAFWFFWGVTWLVLGVHSAIRAMMVHPTDVSSSLASVAWWHHTALCFVIVAALWLNCVPLHFPILLVLNIGLVALLFGIAEASGALNKISPDEEHVADSHS
jgi:hypothetical protein